MSEADYETIRHEFGEVPGGMWAADENARKGLAIRDRLQKPLHDGG